MLLNCECDYFSHLLRALQWLFIAFRIKSEKLNSDIQHLLILIIHIFIFRGSRLDASIYVQYLETYSLSSRIIEIHSRVH